MDWIIRFKFLVTCIAFSLASVAFSWAQGNSVEQPRIVISENTGTSENQLKSDGTLNLGQQDLMKFESQIPERQQYILSHPELFTVRPDGMVEVLQSNNPAEVTKSQIVVAGNPGEAAEQQDYKPELPKNLEAKDLLGMPASSRDAILQNKGAHEITPSVMTRDEVSKLRPDQQKLIELNPTLFEIK